MKVQQFLFLGFRKWHGTRPCKMWNSDGKCFVPLFCGLWIRKRKEDIIKESKNV